METPIALTKREREVLDMKEQQKLRIRTIAFMLGISRKTVEAHLNNARHKLRIMAVARNTRERAAAAGQLCGFN